MRESDLVNTDPVGAAQSRVLDFSTERPDTTPPLRTVTELDAAARETDAATTGISPEETQARLLAEEGRVAPEDAEALMRLDDEAARIDNLEEAALQAAECVMEIK